ncbi:class I SAM-dependent methyltransferase [Parvibaculum sp.]|uniref:class I SAM-dependent methyltransferase n=1 Tax=Parvibaculum sp. TaxID=2024848 RepID=UPI0027320E3F|nr:class I SAM-dependent methyltransferase [Parvibaculum sp.]MDP1627770.1 class I SAM-dependent methyltransferase [Parvibaculum sp.]MDP2150768.1 class I SAM-dependent methyltransferase [Parvibaculum sp.]MDP3328840.1 class I SAM-dependent methyltransferase [Parvibaculum sp.]
MERKTNRARASSKSWDAVANWYLGWAGTEGSRHHRELAIPALMALLAPGRDENILDIGCGAGALAPAILAAQARYTGLDKSRKLIAHARRHHAGHARFLVGDATTLHPVADASFDAAAFLLSIQDIDPLDAALRSAARVLKPGGRLVMLMTHPCFRIPRQSGWGRDEGRALQYRRIDHYLTPLDIPMQEYGGSRAGVTRSYHRPLEVYVSALAASGFVVEAMKEIPAAYFGPPEKEARALRLARQEIPLFLALRARRE